MLQWCHEQPNILWALDQATSFERSTEALNESVKDALSFGAVDLESNELWHDLLPC